jgi:hypothetical protein
VPKLVLPICLLLLLVGPAQAEKLYKHKDANGTIVFSDRQPDAPNFEVSQVDVGNVRSRVSLKKVGKDENCISKIGVTNRAQAVSLARDAGLGRRNFE